MTQRDLEGVGIHSLFSEADRNGTDRERHASQVDIDSKAPLQHPRQFRADVIRAMRAHGLMDSYVFETRKGVHLWSPWLQTRGYMLRYLDLFIPWSSDQFQRTVGRKNGGTVLRFTPKPGEGDKCPCAKFTVPEGESWTTDDMNARRDAGLLPHDPDCPRCYGTGWTGATYVAHIKCPPDALAPWSFWSKPHFDFFQARYGIPTSAAPQPADRAVNCEGLRIERYYTYRPEAKT